MNIKHLPSLILMAVVGVMACSEQKQQSSQATPINDNLHQNLNNTSVEPTDSVDIAINTAMGELTLPNNPHPLAVYDMAAMQNLAVLGVAVDGLPTDLYLPNLKAANTPETQDIGTLLEPDLDALHTLQPKMIVVGADLANQAQKLAKIAPVADMTLDAQDAYESTKQQLIDFGKLFGRQEEADIAIGQIDQAIKDAKAAAKNQGNGLVLLVDGDQLQAYGNHSRYGFLHTAFGVAMADETLKTKQGQSVDFKYLKTINPDWLFVIDKGVATGKASVSAEQTLDNSLMYSTKAWQNQQIVYLSADSYLATGGYYQWLTDAQLIKDVFSAKNSDS